MGGGQTRAKATNGQACFGREGFRGVKVYKFEDLGLGLESLPRKTFQERMAKKSPKERKTSMDSKNENVMCVNQRSGIRNSSNPSFLKNTATNPAPRSVYTPIPMIQNADEHDRGRRFTAINATENCQLFSLFPAIACIAPISSKNNSSCRIAHGTSPSPLPDLTQPYVLALALSAATA